MSDASGATLNAEDEAALEVGSIAETVDPTTNYQYGRPIRDPTCARASA